MIEQILNLISRLSTPGFFVTAEFAQEGLQMPLVIEQFVMNKLRLIQQQEVKGRKFVYKENGWRILFTFFPTDKVVDEKYALKNKVMWNSSTSIKNRLAHA